MEGSIGTYQQGADVLFVRSRANRKALPGRQKPFLKFLRNAENVSQQFYSAACAEARLSFGPSQWAFPFGVPGVFLAVAHY